MHALIPSSIRLNAARRRVHSKYGAPTAHGVGKDFKLSGNYTADSKFSSFFNR